jgi:TonB-dependent starch-binding outer membrane protein SusC
LYLWRTNSDPQASSDGTQIPFRTAPGMSVYDESNPAPYSYKKWGYYNATSPFQGYNPYANEEFDIEKRINETVEGSLYTSATPVKNLEWRTTGGLLARKEQFTRTGLQFYTGDQSRRNFPYFEDSRNSQYLLTLNSVVNYNHTFGKHTVSPMIGIESIQGQRDFVKASFDYYQLSTFPQTVNSGFEVLDPQNLRVRRGESTRDPEARFYSLFGRLNYNYAEKYFFTFNVRRDASSKFSPNKRVGVFPSFSVAWNLHEESFMQDVPFISSLRLRAGSGEIGNSNIPDFAYVSFYEQSNRYSWNNNLPAQGIARRGRFPNPEFQWESIRTNSVALEVGLLENQIDATIEYYTRDTKNMLYEKPIPSSVGFDQTVLTNIGEIRNSGLEITLNYRKAVGDFNFNAGVNGAFNTSEIIQLDGIDKDFNQGNFKFEVGQQIGQFYGLKTAGIYQTDEQAKNGPTVNGNKPRAGDLIYVDKNGDGEIQISDDVKEDDREYLGSAFPKFTYGISGSATYKNFDLSLLFSGAAGMQVSNEMRFYRQALYGVEWNTTRAIFNNSGFNGNGVTDQPAHIHTNQDGTLSFDPYGNYSQFSSYRVEDAGFLKLRNIQLGYRFTPDLIQRTGLSSLRVYVMAQNLFLVTKYSGIDPETNVDFGDDNNRGIRAGEADKLNRYPPTRVLSVGLDFTF